MRLDSKQIGHYELILAQKSKLNYEAFKGINKYHFYDKLEQGYLTKREMDYVILLFRGKSADETATILNLSRKTVENHLDNIKCKLNCWTKFQLVKKITDLFPTSILQTLAIY